MGFYPKLAMTGVRQNRRLYLPFFLSCTGAAALFYILMALSASAHLFSPFGGGTVAITLNFGSYVIAIFSAIFLYYISSFLNRRRRREFGLYNVLGMGKLALARVMLWQTLLVGLGSIASGLALGILLEKLAELTLVAMVRGTISYAINVNWNVAGMTLLVYGVIHLLLLFGGLLQLRKATASELLHSEAYGEKAPRANWAVALLGLVILAAAYYIAIGVADPTEAILWFFAAVILVIIATYLLFVAGSVALCKLLQKNKKYYYKANHFVSVSSMLFRMKRNGAGLASICILATMVLVTLSSTTCLYVGAEDMLKEEYPYEIAFQYYQEHAEAEHISSLRLDPDFDAQAISSEIEKQTIAAGGNISNLACFYRATYYAPMNELFSEAEDDTIIKVQLLDLADYHRATAEAAQLADDEALYLWENYNGAQFASVKIDDNQTFRLTSSMKKPLRITTTPLTGITCLQLVLPDLNEALSQYESHRAPSLDWIYAYDAGLSDKDTIALTASLSDALASPDFLFSYTTRAQARNEYLGVYGSLAFLGVLLSLVFFCSAALIIYYKQISEGYEDQARFDVMQKVGMQPREIRASINSQLLTVFFLPLLGAVVHLCFAFPMIRLMLSMFYLSNVRLFVITCAVSVVVYGLLYTLVYRITSNAYYHIVSGAKERAA